MRLDKYLWCVRLYKTRTQATDACKKGKILFHDEPAKPSLELKAGESFVLKDGSLRYTYRVTAFPASRVGAKLVPDYLADISPDTDRERNQTILLNKKESAFFEGGRPTKKNRRDLDRWIDG